MEQWSLAMCYERGCVSQGFRGFNDSTKTFFFITHGEIKKTPKDRTFTRTHLVVNYIEQKTDPYRIRVTSGGNLINFSGELTMRTANMITSKMLWNNTIFTPEVRYMCTDCANFYLETSMEIFDYMCVKNKLVPQAFIDEYQPQDKIYNEYLYMEIRRSMYGLPQDGMLANKLLKKQLHRTDTTKYHTL